MSTDQPRLVLLISGRGSNMETFIKATATGALPGQIARVISNRPEAPGLRTAQAAGIDTAVIDHRAYESREAFDADLADAVSSEAPALVILAGFMRILSPVFVRPFEGKLLNIHPSLLPLYPGLNTHQRAIDNGDVQAGATVHYVTAQLDGGPAILQAAVPILPDDTASALAARTLTVEHQIYPEAAAWHLSGRLHYREGRAWLDDKLLPASGVRWQP
mgnify:CR=1 FL=1